MLPVVAAQVIVNVTGVVWFAVTEAGCVFPPLTVQLGGTPPSVTEWFPALSPTNVTVPEAPIPLVVPPVPFTVTVYPAAGALAGVLVVTVNAPVVGGGGMMLNGSLNLLRGPALAS